MRPKMRGRYFLSFLCAFSDLSAAWNFLFHFAAYSSHVPGQSNFES
ncbi:protein of unassigned function [Methylobacterium oryzae CBMB20]|uniref:Protein of unassigned function n=1 Tax=Methylobacterium oryzae CBMB20 TaxID=693986 RepID=A0A089NY44_9HYPH|nr:protein of unassigned function [Methylobacterium oryzae CBMB20]